MPDEREVGGIRCGEVLAVLGDYVDGELVPSRRAQVDAHLAGCDWCERFGGSMAGLVGQLRARSGESAPPGLLARVLAGEGEKR